MKEEKSCGAVVVAGDEYLLIRHAPARHWDFPKGHVEKGETEIQTAEREVLEETGLKVEFIDGFKEEVRYLVGGAIPKKVVFFLAKTPHKDVRCQEGEIDSHKWLKYEDALKWLTYDNAKELLKKADAFLYGD